MSELLRCGVPEAQVNMNPLPQTIILLPNGSTLPSGLPVLILLLLGRRR